MTGFQGGDASTAGYDCKRSRQWSVARFSFRRNARPALKCATRIGPSGLADGIAEKVSTRGPHFPFIPSRPFSILTLLFNNNNDNDNLTFLFRLSLPNLSPP